MDDQMQAMLSQVAKLVEVSDEEASRIMAAIYKDGVVSRAEAEAVFRVRRDIQALDANWSARFVETIRDFILFGNAPTGWVSQDEADWLLGQLSDGQSEPLRQDIDLLVSLLRNAEGAPESLGKAAVEGACRIICRTRKAKAQDIERLRGALYAQGGDGGMWVTAYEAGLLFQTNDAIAFAKNDPAWNDLFARAIANHLLARAHPDPATEMDALRREAWLSEAKSDPLALIGKSLGSFNSGDWFQSIFYDTKKASEARMAADEAANRAAAQITDDEFEWVVRHLGKDERHSPAEEALIAFLDEELPGFTAGISCAA